MTGACFLGIRPAAAAAWASAASKRSMWRRVARSEKASAVAAAAPKALTRAPAISAVEEDGFVRAAEMDRQSPRALGIALGEQGRAAGRLDHLQHRVLGVGRIAVEIKPRRDAVQQAAGEDADIDVRRLHAAGRPRYPA